jgi:drug/metabolite transporter (DMT)-like permease
LQKPFRGDTSVSKEMRGIAITLAAMLLFALMDALSKYLSTRYPTPQILWLRYLFTVPLLLVVLPPRRFNRSLPSRRPWLQCCRALLLATEIGLVIWAFGRLPLADVHAVLALTPLVVTGLSVPLLGERVSPRQWAAVAAGFSGVLIVLRPGLDVVQSSTLVVLVAVLLYALYQVLTRLVGRVDGAETSLLWQTVIGTIVLGGVAVFFWQTPALEHWPLFILTAVLGGSGHFLLIRALQMAPVAVTQPFTYTLLLWAVITGYLLFGDLPDQWTVIGAAIVIAAGSYSALQDRQSRHPPQSEHVS